MATNGRSDAAKGRSAWYCEEHVRLRLILWLRDHGYFQTHDPTAPDRDDTLVVRSVYGAISRIAVRGFPGGDARDEARQWFAGALLDLVQRRNSTADVSLALALPAGFTAYTTLAAEIAWLRGAMPLTIYWVTESGKVQAE